MTPDADTERGRCSSPTQGYTAGVRGERITAKRESVTSLPRWRPANTPSSLSPLTSQNFLLDSTAGTGLAVQDETQGLRAPAPKVHSSCSCLHPGSAPGKDSAVEPPQPRRCTVPAPACTQGLHQARTLLWSRPSPEGAQFLLLPAPRVCTRQGLCCGAAPAPKVHSSRSCLHPGSAPGKDSAVEPPQPRRCTVPAPACTQGLHQARTLLWSRPSPEGAQFPLLPAPRVCTRQGLCCGAAPAPKVHSSCSCLHPGSAPGKDSAVEPPQPRRCTVPAPACTHGNAPIALTYSHAVITQPAKLPAQ
ncbi:nematocyst expressed protein 3-like isoform X2 [Alexandromys fortis]|uniref:nematocyst expressed protein 3-like isoform X2 n=1 Tax=Alexandromys fortis TaxID=100897 RepID=UPI002152191C|nr:nematocyst expressed protein 3-like isoform X2 [Microtus fortis]